MFKDFHILVLIIILVIKVQSLRNLVYAWADHVKKFVNSLKKAKGWGRNMPQQ